ncbi:MAG TPA: DUF6046 domain-containing protein [Flavipsychrobacter sp.]|nr:DUF6046 domain-containing protein [Flavipsychrobacter sp.]
MAEISFSIPDLFQQAFGFSPDEPQFQDLSVPVLQSKNGSPYYGFDGKGRRYFMPVTLGGLTLQYPVVDITVKKTIVDTPMVNRRGSVKELISIQEYEINIKGLIVGLTPDYPENEVTALRELFEKNESVAIVCPKTDIFLITQDRASQNNQGTNLFGTQAKNQVDQVVITELKLVTAGKSFAPNVQPYEMNLSSDTPFSLIYGIPFSLD